MIKVLFISVLFLAYHSYGQKFADKEYYLVDSLVYENIAPEYQELLEYGLELYHKAETDMDRIDAVNQIVKLCWDENVWPKYNQWVYDYSGERLKEPQSDTTRIKLLQAYAGSIYYIGWNYSVKTEYDKCIFYFEKCEEIYTEIKDSIGIANALDNIGNIYLAKGESAKALDYFTESLDIREMIGHEIGAGSSLNSIGSTYMEHGDYASALTELERALELYDKAGFTSGVSSVLNNLGVIETHFGNYEVALSYFNRSFAIKDMIGDKQGKAMSLAQIGMNHIHLEALDSALIYFEKSLTLYDEIGDKRGAATSLCNVGFIYRVQGKLSEAKDYFNKALGIANETGASKVSISALEGLFYTNVSEGNLDNAEKNILEIIEMRRRDVNVNFTILPEQKKEFYFQTMSKNFMDLYAFAQIRNSQNPSITEAVYNSALKLKGLLLKSTAAMQEAILTSKDEELIEMYNKWIHLKKEIAKQYAIGGATDSLELTAIEMEKSLIKRSKAFSEFSENDDLNWKDIQSKLKPGEAAIEFVRFNSELENKDSIIRYAALIVTVDSEYPKMINLCTVQEIEELVGTNNQNNLGYIQDLYGTSQDPNDKLYKLIWNPIEKELSAQSTVYFSATGLLHKIAFSALSISQDEFLSDRYKLAQLNSTSQLVDSKPNTFANSKTASLFGGVKYNTEKTEQVTWTYLPGTLDEIDSIYVKLKDKIDVSYFSKIEATEETFKKVVPSSNIVHIASHGFFYPNPEEVQKEIYTIENNEEIEFRGGGSNYGIWNFVNNKNPLMRSGIALAGSNDMWQREAFDEGEDGVLTAQEVTTLNMRNTDLVVLSACETGLGDIRGNEGVYGLQRAFKIAGVKYLVMSLWQVPDKETAEFMNLFYDKLLIQKDIRKAFSETQIEMREKYDPYYWAAFVLIE